MIDSSLYVERITSEGSNGSVQRPEMCRLPPEVLYKLQQTLQQGSEFQTMALLMRCSKAFRDIFQQGLGQRIVLGGTVGDHAVKDLIGIPKPFSLTDVRSFSVPVRKPLKVNTREARFGPYSTRPRWDQDDSIIHPPIHPEKITQLQDVIAKRQRTEAHETTYKKYEKCEYLHLVDLRGAESLIEAIEAAGQEPGCPNLFRYIKYLSLGKELIWTLMMETLPSAEMIKRLTERLEPRNVCFKLDIFPKWDTLRRLERMGVYHGEKDPAQAETGDLDRVWRYHYRIISQKTLQTLIVGWAPATVTIHNVTAEYLPVSYSHLTRIYYAKDPPKREAEVDETCWNINERADDISNLVGMVNDNEKYEFIAAEDLPNLNVKKKVERGEEVDPRLGDWCMKERVRQQMGNHMAREAMENNVKFVEREKSEACVCCGGR